jgi:hypothetical protein
MPKTCMLCEAEIHEDNPNRFCSECGEEGCKRCVAGENDDDALCLDCADEPGEEDFEDDGGDEDDEDDDTMEVENADGISDDEEDA